MSLSVKNNNPVNQPTESANSALEVFEQALLQAKDKNPKEEQAPSDASAAVKDGFKKVPLGSDAKKDFRMATGNEVWPPVQDIKIVGVPEKAQGDTGALEIIAFQGKGDAKITVVRREDNPKFFDYLSAISRIPEPYLKGVQQTIGDGGKGDSTKAFVRNDDPSSVKLQDVWMVLGAEIISVSMNPGTDGAQQRFISRELTPKLYDRMAAVRDADKSGFELVTDEKGVTDRDLADGAVIFRPDKDNGLVRVELKNGDKKLVSSETTPKLYDFLSAKSDEFSSSDRSKAVEEARDKAGLPSTEELDVASLETSEKNEDGKKLTVTELAWKNAMAKWKEGIEKGDIKTDDDRAKLFRALQAQTISEEGLDMFTLDIGAGVNLEPTQGRDFDQIIDKDGLKRSVTDLIGSEAVSKDIAAERKSAFDKVENADKLIEELEEMAFSSEYATYIQDLTNAKKNEIAEDDIAATYGALLVADPEKAKTFAQNMQINSMTMELDSYVGDPSKISDENLTAAAHDIGKMILTIIKKGGLDVGRRLAESEKFIQEMLSDKKTAKDFAKAMQELGATYSKTGEVTSKDVEKLLGSGKYTSLSEMPNGGALKAFNDLTKAGIIGSLGGTVSLISAVYQLAGKGGSLADTTEERLAIAKDFVSFVGAGKHFGDLANNIIGHYNEGVRAHNEEVERKYGNNTWEIDVERLKKKPVAPLIGLDKTLDELLKAPSEKVGGGKTLSSELAEAVDKDLTAAAGGTKDSAFYNKLLDNAGVKDGEALAKGLTDGYQVRPELKDAAGKPAAGWHKGASAALLVMSAGADTFAGAADVAIGALTIKKGLSTGDDNAVAKGAIQVAAGGFGVGGGLASFAGLSKALGFIKAVAAPSFVVSAILSLATLIPDIISDVKRTKKTEGYRDDMRDFFTQLEQDGVLNKDGLDKYRFLDAYMRNYGQRDAPDDESIFDYREDEVQNFLEYWEEKGDKLAERGQFTSDFGLYYDGGHKDYKGDGPNLETTMNRGSTVGS